MEAFASGIKPLKTVKEKMVELKGFPGTTLNMDSGSFSGFGISNGTPVSGLCSVLGKKVWVVLKHYLRIK